MDCLLQKDKLPLDAIEAALAEREEAGHSCGDRCEGCIARDRLENLLVTHAAVLVASARRGKRRRCGREHEQDPLWSLCRLCQLEDALDESARRVTEVERELADSRRVRENTAKVSAIFQAKHADAEQARQAAEEHAEELECEIAEQRQLRETTIIEAEKAHDTLAAEMERERNMYQQACINEGHRAQREWERVAALTGALERYMLGHPCRASDECPGKNEAQAALDAAREEA